MIINSLISQSKPKSQQTRHGRGNWYLFLFLAPAPHDWHNFSFFPYTGWLWRNDEDDEDDTDNSLPLDQMGCNDADKVVFLFFLRPPLTINCLFLEYRNIATRRWQLLRTEYNDEIQVVSALSLSLSFVISQLVYLSHVLFHSRLSHRTRQPEIDYCPWLSVSTALLEFSWFVQSLPRELDYAHLCIDV